MAVVYFLIKSRVVSFESRILRFNVLAQKHILQSEIFEVAWDNNELVAPHYCDPANPTLNRGAEVMLALSRRYCEANGYSVSDVIKKPNYLEAEAPPGGWFVLESLTPKRLVLEGHDGASIDLLDPASVLPGSPVLDEEGRLRVVISEAAKIALGISGELPRFEGEQPRIEPAPSTSERQRLRDLLIAIANTLQ